MGLNENQKIMRLDKICEVHGYYLEKFMPWADGEILLKTIATIESSYGAGNKARYEPAYDVGGRYSSSNRERLEKFGKLAAMSYSSFQIMFPTACELGYNGSPYDLGLDEIAAYWVVEYLRRRGLDKGATTLQQVFDFFNSGNFKDKNVPEEYIAKSMACYVKLHSEKYGVT